MIDFAKLDLPWVARTLSTISTPTENIQYFDVGRMVELIYEECSNGLLVRQNSTGVDLVDSNNVTYESKKVTFKNVAKKSVRGAIVMNGWGEKDVSDFVPADYYIFTDPKLLRACCVPSNMLYDIKKSGTNIVAHCNPQPEHFFLDGGERIDRDYFEEKEIFARNFIRSMK